MIYKNAIFISTSLELKRALEAMSNEFELSKKDDYFWIDPEIHRWKSLIV